MTLNERLRKCQECKFNESCDSVYQEVDSWDEMGQCASYNREMAKNDNMGNKKKGRKKDSPEDGYRFSATLYKETERYLAAAAGLAGVSRTRYLADLLLKDMKEHEDEMKEWQLHEF